MRKFVIVFLVVIVVVVGLLVLALVNLDRLVDRNRHRILAQAEQALGRKVNLGEIDVSLWPGIGVKLQNFAVSDDRSFSPGDFVRARNLQVSLKLLPLLRKEIQVKRIVLNQPAITVIRNPEGDFNFATLGGPAKEAKEKKPGAPGPREPGALPVLLVSLLDVSDGELHFVDKKGGVDLRVKRVGLRVDDFGLERPFSVDLSAAVLSDKKNISLNAKVARLGPQLKVEEAPVEARISVDNLDLAALKRAYPKIQSLLPKDLSLSGPVSLKDAVVKGTLKDLSIGGSLDLTGGTISYGSLFQKPRDVKMSLVADARLKPDEVVLNSATVSLDKLELGGKGKLRLDGRPSVDIALRTDATDLGGWDRLFPALKDRDLTGKVQSRVEVKGSLAKGQTPAIKGTLKLDNVGLRTAELPQPITGLTSNVVFSGRRAEIEDAALRVGKSQLRLAAKIEDFSPLKLSYTLASPELRLADFLRGDGARSDVVKALESRGELRVRNEKVSYQGQLKSAQGTVARVNYTELQADVAVADPWITITNLDVKAFKGAVHADGKLEFRGPGTFGVTARAKGLDLNEYFRSALASAPKHIEGRLNADIKMTARGKSWTTIKPTLQGSGSAEVVDGRLLDFNLAEEVLTGITGVPGLTDLLGSRVKEKYPEIFTKKTTEFEELKSSFRAANGGLDVTDLSIRAADYRVRGKGRMDFDQRLDFSSVLQLSRKLSDDLAKSAREVRYILGSDGRLEIPFVLKGTLPSVRPRPDVARLTELVQRGLVRKGAEELGKRIFGGSKKSGEESQTGKPTGKPPVEELIKKGLEQLFGR